MLHISGETVTYSDWFDCYLVTCRLRSMPELLSFPALAGFLFLAHCFLFLAMPLHSLLVLYIPVYEIVFCPATVCHVAGAEASPVL
jgi:hypothetical protein